MSEPFLHSLFSLEGKVAVVTGGSGALGTAMAKGLAQAGARVAVLARRIEPVTAIVAAIETGGGTALALSADVRERAQVERACATIVDRWERVDILVNAAGGNMPGATLAPEASLLDLDPEAFRAVVDLNLIGVLLPSLVFGATMITAPGQGTIINISSMAAQRPLTRIAGYSAAKAAVENLTRWMAIELARRYGSGLRVNAIAPGFFIGEQNRALLLNPDGSLTARGEHILAHTPAGRLGVPEDLIATLIWLCSPGAAFVNGAVIPVDGGFSAFSGV
ncbi:MAG: SDR family oxidoreductase [Roseiflexus sp.]|nr:SDR family oxidoreductase [Roseiflexus sp.]